MSEHVHEKELSAGAACECCNAHDSHAEHSHKSGARKLLKTHDDADDCESGCGCGHEHGSEQPERREIIEIAAGAALFAAGLVMNLAFDLKTVYFLPVLIAAYILLGREVIFDAVQGLFSRSIFNENLLMTIATLGAFAIGGFDEAVGVMLFYRVGEWFEHRAAGSARRSVTALLDIRPDTANLLQNGALIAVPPDEVAVGDLIMVRPGERVPLDGVITEGASALDTSALTGESVPRNVEYGDTALSGCVNISGALTIRVEKPFGESTVEKILELVQIASAKKAPAEKLITRFAKYYTPAVVALAVLIAALPPLLGGAEFAVWLKKALTLLVISCPCALVLSIPLAFFSGIGAASRRGVLIKGGNYLDALNKLDTVAFDKTGTLTYGRFSVAAVNAVTVTEDELLELAASAECHSTHPIARSILEAYGKTPDIAAVCDYEELPGNGVRARIHGETVHAGNAAFFAAEGIAVPQLQETAGVHVLIARGGEFAGYITATDTIRPDSGFSIQELRRRGIKTVMLTGDNDTAASEVAGTLGIDRYHAGLLPAGKVEAIETLIKEREGSGKLAFLGDGINDAPVLSMSDIGIAMGGLGSDAAIESADIILMNDEPSRLCETLDIAAKTRRIVAQNIVLALGVKASFLALGIFGDIAMWTAVFADVGVALLAVLNSTRIGRLKINQ